MKALGSLIVDDHAAVREGLKLLLNNQFGFTVVGETSCGKEACSLATQLQPGIVVMDVFMPGIGGAKATKRLRTHHPQIKIWRFRLTKRKLKRKLMCPKCSPREPMVTS